MKTWRDTERQRPWECLGASGSIGRKDKGGSNLLDFHEGHKCLTPPVKQATTKTYKSRLELRKLHSKWIFYLFRYITKFPLCNSWIASQTLLNNPRKRFSYTNVNFLSSDEQYTLVPQPLHSWSHATSMNPNPMPFLPSSGLIGRGFFTVETPVFSWKSGNTDCQPFWAGEVFYEIRHICLDV